MSYSYDDIYSLHAWRDNSRRLVLTQGEGYSGALSDDCTIKAPHFQLNDERGVITIPSDTAVTMAIIRPDDTEDLINCTPIDKEKGVFCCPIRKSITAIAGVVKAEVRLTTASNAVIKFYGIEFYIYDGVSNNAIAQSPEFDALVEALSKVEAVTVSDAELIALDSIIQKNGVHPATSGVIYDYLVKNYIQYKEIDGNKVDEAIEHNTIYWTYIDGTFGVIYCASGMGARTQYFFNTTGIIRHRTSTPNSSTNEWSAWTEWTTLTDENRLTKLESKINTMLSGINTALNNKLNTGTVSKSEKQLFNLEDGIYEKDGITVNVTNNHIRVSGTNETDSTVYVEIPFVNGLSTFSSKEEYIASCQNFKNNKSGHTPVTGLYLWGKFGSDGGKYQSIILTSNTLSTIIATDSDTTVDFRIAVVGDKIEVDIEFDFMIERGTEQTTFEPYYCISNENLSANLKNTLNKKLSSSDGSVLLRHLNAADLITDKIEGGNVKLPRSTAVYAALADIANNVNTALRKKANTEDVNTALEGVGNGVNTALALKVNNADVINEFDKLFSDPAKIPTVMAVMDYLNGYYYSVDETYSDSDIDSALALKYDAANVESGSGQLSVQEAADTSVVKSAVFEYQRTGTICDVFVKIVFNAGTGNYFSFSGLPYATVSSLDLSNRHKYTTVTSKYQQTTVIPRASWVTVFFNREVTFTQDEELSFHFCQKIK